MSDKTASVRLNVCAAQREFLAQQPPALPVVSPGLCAATRPLREMPWRIITPPPVEYRAELTEYLKKLSYVVLPPAAEIEHVNPLAFDMLVEDGRCHECDAALPRGSLIWQKPAGPWWPAGRSGAWFWRPSPAHFEVCQTCAAAELMPQWDELERERIIAAARCRLAENARTARAVVDGITWTVTVRLDQAEWLMASVCQTEVLPGCHLWGLARWTPEVVELSFEGLPRRIRRELERELWLELNVRGSDPTPALLSGAEFVEQAKEALGGGITEHELLDGELF
jgi:hypothetical protein